MDIMNVIRQCGKRITDEMTVRLKEWEAEMPDRPVMTITRLLDLIPDDGVEEVLTTTQADMNVSSGKLGIKRLAAQSSLERSIFGFESEDEEWNFNSSGDTG